MNFDVRLSKSAQRYLSRLDTTTQRRILERLDDVAAEPFGHHTKSLSGRPGARAARVGGYRVIFSVDDTNKIVNVSDIGPRGQIYRELPS